MIARLLDAPFESRAARTSRPMRGRVAIVMDDIPFLGRILKDFVYEEGYSNTDEREIIVVHGDLQV